MSEETKTSDISELDVTIKADLAIAILNFLAFVKDKGYLDDDKELDEEVGLMFTTLLVSVPQEAFNMSPPGTSETPKDDTPKIIVPDNKIIIP